MNILRAEKAVLIDLSSLRKFEILDPDAEELMNYTLTRNIKKLSVGQIVYSSMCYENGIMFDDGTLLKLNDHGFGGFVVMNMLENG